MDGTPLYQEIYDDLRKRIESGEFSENSVLPAERVLCELYHVSRSTMRAALELLRQNDFIKPKMFEQRLTKFHSFAESLKSQHILIKNQILDYELIESDKYLASLNLPEKSLRTAYWHKLTRLRSAETFPLMIETSYLPQSRFMALEPNIIQDGSLYAYLENYYNMEITDADELFSPILPTSKERMLLQIPTHIACMLCERFCQERDNLIAIHRTVVRGDKFKFRAAYFLDS